MLSALTFILISIIVVPLVLIIIILAFGLSFIARITRPRYSGARHPQSKPKGTVEVLPAETEEESEKFKDKAKDRRVGKDKFREL